MARKPIQGSIFEGDVSSLDTRKRSAKQEAARWSSYIVGGWPEFTHWIDPREVVLCVHDHGPVDPKVAAALIRRALVPSLLVKRCLLRPWHQFAAGTECVTYGSVNDPERKFDLFILQGGL